MADADTKVWHDERLQKLDPGGGARQDLGGGGRQTRDPGSTDEESCREEGIY